MERKEYIDIAKGISMICIVLGHLGIYNINRVVYTFMVSVFFLITGYFINNKRDIKLFVWGKFKRLIIPYVFVSCVIILFAVGINEFFEDGVNSKEIALKWIVAAMFGTGASDVCFMGYDVPGIGAIWFLLATFWGAIVLRFLLDLKPMFRLLLVVLILFVSVWSAKIVFLPLSLQPGGVALFFMYAGYLMKQAEPYLKYLSIEFKILGFIIASLCWIEAVIDYQWFLLVLADVGRGMTDIFRSLCGCFLVIMLAKLLEKNKLLRKFFGFIGEYSIVFLSVHLIELNFWSKISINNWLITIGLSEILSFWSVVLLRFVIIMFFVALLSKCNITRKIFGYPMIKKEKNDE